MEAVVAGFGFGFGEGVGNDDDFKVTGKIEIAGSLDCFGVVLFEKE